MNIPDNLKKELKESTKCNIVKHVIESKYTNTIYKTIVIVRDPDDHHKSYIRSNSAAINVYRFIFNKKYKNINMRCIDDIKHFNVPKCGSYFVQLDNFTFVICNVSHPLSTTNNTGKTTDTRTYVFEYTFIGKNCHIWVDKIIRKSNHFSRKIKEMQTNMKTIRIYLSDTDAMRIKCKPIDIIIKNQDMINSINTIDNFVCSRNTYQEYSIPYKLGILIHGVPGTGKTSFAHSIATKYRMSILNITAENIFDIMKKQKQPADLFPCVFHNNPDELKFIVVIEEIDSLFKTGTLSSTNDKGDIDGSGTLRRDQILKFIDLLPENIILIATTNFINDLSPKTTDNETNTVMRDDALIRAGRFDILLEMKSFNKEQSLEMIHSYDMNDSFIDNYTDFPICPAELQRDIIQKICKDVLKTEDNINE